MPKSLDLTSHAMINRYMLNLEDAKLEKHSVTISGHRTSITLEHGFWRELTRLAETRGIAMNELVRQIDEARGGGLSGALRAFVLQELKAGH